MESCACASLGRFGEGGESVEGLLILTFKISYNELEAFYLLVRMSLWWSQVKIRAGHIVPRCRGK